MAKTRRAYTGAAVSTTTSSSIAASGTTSFTITAYTGWPYGSDPFYVVVEPGTASEEKILVTRTGSTDTTINVASDSERGQDGTSAVSHSSGVTVFPVFTAVDADEANELASSWSTKGDLVSYGSSTFETLGVGSDSQVLVADSGESSGLRWADVQHARNLVYNGAMQVAQRGTSTASITTTGYYTADRWQFLLSSMGTWTQSVENDSPTGSGFRKSLKMLCTTADAAPAASDYLFVQQKFEGQDLQHIKKGTSSAEQVTVSFWVKSNATGAYVVEFYDEDNTRQVSASYSISASGTWEKKTVTFPADTTGAFNNDNTAAGSIVFWLGAGSNFTSGTLNTTWASSTNANRVVGQTNLAAATNNYWQVTGVQLEVGPQATPFEHLPYGFELARCQRYYYNPALSTNTGALYESSNYWFIVRFPIPVAMRATPTVSGVTDVEYVNTFGGGSPVSSILLAGGNKNDTFFVIAKVTSITTVGHAFSVTVFDGSVSAEL